MFSKAFHLSVNPLTSDWCYRCIDVIELYFCWISIFNPSIFWFSWEILSRFKFSFFYKAVYKTFLAFIKSALSLFNSSLTSVSLEIIFSNFSLALVSSEIICWSYYLVWISDILAVSFYFFNFSTKFYSPLTFSCRLDYCIFILDSYLYF